jgi:hypothetical protein
MHSPPLPRVSRRDWLRTGRSAFIGFVISAIWAVPSWSMAQGPGATQPTPPAAKPNPGAPKPGGQPAAPGKTQRPRLLGDLLGPQPESAPDPLLQRQAITPDAAAAAGLRRLVGKHLTIYTDVPSSPAVDELPQVFDLAMAPWCERFGIDPARVAAWRLTGYLMRDGDRFRKINALPGGLPPFKNGFHMGDEFWWYEQSSDYYRRHLLLHEGTHVFMSRWLGGIGPPWYAEGMAELMSTHRWREGQLQLGYAPRDRDELTDWGRVKIIQDDFAAGRGKSLEAVFQYDLRTSLEVEAYGWSWAAAHFLDSHPKSQAVFRSLIDDAREGGPEFSRRLIKRLGDDWEDLSEEWQLFVSQAEYGYDVPKAAIERRPAQPLTSAEIRLKVAADKGWQSSGVELEAGESYEVAAVGRYQIAAGPPVWWSETGGVTIRYHRGQPLGILQGAVRGEAFSRDKLTPLVKPLAIGRKQVVSPAESGTLYLRVNESPRDLADNTGEILVRIRRLAP